MSSRFALLGVICVSTCPALTAQSRWDRQVDARLSQATTTLGHGYRRVGIAGRGTLNTGETVRFSIELPLHIATVLTGVCDEDCADLDLSLSTNGYDVDAAHGGGNAPIVRVTPSERTSYVITVRMGDCRHNPCWFGIGIFRQSPTDSH